jgi:hypothetical protein
MTMRTSSKRLGVALALVAGLSPFLAGAAAPRSAKPGPTSFTGKVVPLADLVARAGLRLDSDAAPHWLALVTADGKVYPLIKDDRGRLFFKDKALLNRPMRITGRLLPGSQMLGVIAAHSLIKGKPHEVFYWCDICSIRRGEKQICECCGGPMVLREEPLTK